MNHKSQISTTGRRGFLGKLIFVAVFPLFLCGCFQFLRPVIGQRQVPVPASTKTEVISVPQPPQVTVTPQIIKGETVFVTNTVSLPPLLITNTVYVPGTNYTVSITNGYEVNPILLKGIEVAKNLNGSLNPTPTAPLVNIGLGALGTLAALIAGFQTRRLNKEQGLHATTYAAVETVVDNFESLRKLALTIPGYTHEMDHKLMDLVKRVQTENGVKDIIHGIVVEKNGDTIVPTTLVPA